MNLDNTEEEVDVTYIHYTHKTNSISMNDDVNVSINIMNPSYRQITKRAYLE